MNTESIPNEIEIVWLRRISQSQPTAWEGHTRNQQAVHIFYKYGRLEVWLRCPAKGERSIQVGDDHQFSSGMVGNRT
jgi:hypothetical protein